MEKKGKWTLQTAREMVERNGCKLGYKAIEVPEKGIGIKTWGAVDYLCHKEHHFLGEVK